MRKVFIDTSAFVAYFYSKDQNHFKAKQILEKIREKKTIMVTTDYIFDECITGILSNVGHRYALRAGEFILNSKIIEMVWLDESMKLKAWEYFKKHADKKYSFTDCTSFVLMKEMKINDFFAFDGDFIKAGFTNFLDK
jgi:hypothetical protein